jgi:HD-GYP domain-containing protein (c-di-GMP phosphodiesterase class II)
VYSHHEKWDGNGYPRGLKGEEIPLGARIFSVVDAFDAMTFDRPYSRAIGFDAATAEIKRCAGTHFDPAVVDSFLRVPEALFEEIRRRSIEP